MKLETQRLTMRHWEPSDAKALYKYACEPEIGLAAGWRPHTSEEDSAGIIKTALSAPETYAICLKPGGEPVGSIGLHLNGSTDMTERDDECELGYWIGKPYWNRGLVTEAAREMIRHAFEELGMRAVWCGFYDGNSRSKRVQEKCGFLYHHTTDGLFLESLGETRTGHCMLLTKQQWLSGLIVRELRESEIPAALKLAWEVFSEFEAPDYSAGGVEEFRKTLENKSYLSGLKHYGAFINGEQAGLLSVKPEKRHICFFFVRGKLQRKGIGTKLFNRLLADCRGCTITLNSSPFGVPFYKALGFTPTDSEQNVNGIRFTPMSKEA